MPAETSNPDTPVKVCKNDKCQRPESEWPMCFRGDDTCSVACRKAVAS